MKVVFLEDVEGVAQGGEVKDVRPGFARNYLIPKNLAILATHDSLQRLSKLSNKAVNNMTALGEKLTGIRVDLEMRSGPGGRLYGSVTNAIVASKLSELLETDIDRRIITIEESIRNVGSFTARIRLHQEVNIDIELLVHPTDIDPETFIEQLAEQEASPDENDQIESVVETSENDNMSSDVPEESSNEVDDEPNANEDTAPKDDPSKAELDSDTDAIVDEKKS